MSLEGKQIFAAIRQRGKAYFEIAVVVSGIVVFDISNSMMAKDVGSIGNRFSKDFKEGIPRLTAAKNYARKLMEAGVFTELYVEPGVPHAYEDLEGTPQTERFYELRDRATARMLGLEYSPKASGNITGFVDFLKYLFGN